MKKVFVLLFVFCASFTSFLILFCSEEPPVLGGSTPVLGGASGEGAGEESDETRGESSENPYDDLKGKTTDPNKIDLFKILSEGTPKARDLEFDFDATTTKLPAEQYISIKFWRLTRLQQQKFWPDEGYLRDYDDSGLDLNGTVEQALAILMRGMKYTDLIMKNDSFISKYQDKFDELNEKLNEIKEAQNQPDEDIDQDKIDELNKNIEDLRQELRGLSLAFSFRLSAESDEQENTNDFLKREFSCLSTRSKYFSQILSRPELFKVLSPFIKTVGMENEEFKKIFSDEEGLIKSNFIARGRVDNAIVSELADLGIKIEPSIPDVNIDDYLSKILGKEEEKKTDTWDKAAEIAGKTTGILDKIAKGVGGDVGEAGKNIGDIGKAASKAGRKIAEATEETSGLAQETAKSTKEVVRSSTEKDKDKPEEEGAGTPPADEGSAL